MFQGYLSLTCLSALPCSLSNKGHQQESNHTAATLQQQRTLSQMITSPPPAHFHSSLTSSPRRPVWDPH
ncbi:hypothetical protein CHARACLAT_022652 [Characodon lateralis]|uniref:Secreted protein n=1 Tax=Characodon lateralis TaxID=208331 RepID=A0ABU7EVW2_9TELE|nr:hypothetical protein [Characodon lateralis]